MKIVDLSEEASKAIDNAIKELGKVARSKGLVPGTARFYMAMVRGWEAVAGGDIGDIVADIYPDKEHEEFDDE